MPPSAARMEQARALQAAQEAEAASKDTFCGFKIKYVAVSALIVQHVASVMMLRYCRATDGEKDFSSQTAVITSEAMKIVAACALTLMEEGSLHSVFQNKAELLKMSIPALLYLLASNMEYLAAAELEAAVFTLFLQSKLIMVAILSVAILGRVLRCIQWIALVLVTCGIIFVKMSKEEETEIEADVEKQDTFLGLLLLIGAAYCSSLAGVYFELVLKSTQLSLWARNVQLAGYSIVIGLVGLACTHDVDDVQDKGFFHGYTRYTWAIVSIQAGGGLLVALVIKYADNIIKDFTGSIGTVLTCLFSAVFMDFHITLHFCIGFVFVMSGMTLYTSEGFVGLDRYGNCCGCGTPSTSEVLDSSTSEVLDPSGIGVEATSTETQGLISKDGGSSGGYDGGAAAV